MQNLLVPAALLALSGAAFGQNIVVTAEGRHGAPPPEVTRDEITVDIGKHPAHVEEWTPLGGDRAALDLYIAIDDGLDTDVGIQFKSLKSFFADQPASTRIGLAYLRNGEALIAAPLTSDHQRVAAALRLPLGEPGISASPYVSLSDLIKKWPSTGSDLIKKWPSTGARREILVISSGADPYSPADALNPYLLNTIEDAQRAGILVHSIYYAGAGHLGHNFFRINWGVNYLSELGDGTGGEAYWQGFGSPVAFDSFLKDFNQRLTNQYLLTLTPADSKGGLEPIRIMSSNPQVSLVAPKQISFARPVD